MSRARQLVEQIVEIDVGKEAADFGRLASKYGAAVKGRTAKFKTQGDIDKFFDAAEKQHPKWMFKIQPVGSDELSVRLPA